MNKKNNKILSFSQLEKKIQSLKLRNKKIVLCHGVFDLLHIGHIKHFEEAKNFGDTLERYNLYDTKVVTIEIV